MDASQWTDWQWDATYGRFYRVKRDGTNELQWQDIQGSSYPQYATTSRSSYDSNPSGGIHPLMPSYDDSSVPRSSDSTAYDSNEHDSHHETRQDSDYWAGSQHQYQDRTTNSAYLHQASPAATSSWLHTHGSRRQNALDRSSLGYQALHTSPSLYANGSDQSYSRASINAAAKDPYDSLRRSQGDVVEEGEEGKEEEEEEEAEARKEAKGPHDQRMTTFNTLKTDLDPAFKEIEGYQRIKSFFKPGRVFALLWTEPAKQSGSDMADAFSVVKLGQHAYTEIRRFIVIRNFTHHSLCLPIATYRGQGTLHRPDADHHSIAYANGSSPMPLPGERLSREPICIILRDNEKLAPQSRINFSKIYTIEHNVKVKAMGRVEPDSLQWAIYYTRLSSGLI